MTRYAGAVASNHTGQVTCHSTKLPDIVISDTLLLNNYWNRSKFESSLVKLDKLKVLEQAGSLLLLLPLSAETSSNLSNLC